MVGKVSYVSCISVHQIFASITRKSRYDMEHRFEISRSEKQLLEEWYKILTQKKNMGTEI